MLPEWAKEGTVESGTQEQIVEIGDEGPAAAVDTGEVVEACAVGSLADHHARQEL